MLTGPFLGLCLWGLLVGAVQSALRLPDTSGIDGQLTANLQVDHFFSLWIVFNDDEVKISGKYVIKRWTQIRDAWVKTLHASKTSKKSGSAAIPVKPYKYHKELSFLKKIVDPEDTHENISATRNENIEEDTALEENSDEHIVVNEDEIDGENDKPDKVEKNQVFQKPPEDQTGTRLNPRKRKHVSEVDEKMMRLIDNQLNQPKEKAEEDRNLTFFKSVLPSLKAFDDDQTLQIQSAVTNVIESTKRRQTNNDWSHRSYNYGRAYHNEYHQGYFTRLPEQSPSNCSIQLDPAQPPAQSPSAASCSTQFGPAQSPTQSPSAASCSTQFIPAQSPAQSPSAAFCSTQFGPAQSPSETSSSTLLDTALPSSEALTYTQHSVQHWQHDPPPRNLKTRIIF